MKVTRKAVKGARKAYNTGVKTVGQTMNGVMKPLTRSMTRVARKAPVVGGRKGLLPAVVGVPRRVTRAAIAAGLAVPTVAGRVGGTGVKVVRHTVLDPLHALGASSPLVVLGLSPSGKPKRMTRKKPAKKSRARK